ncbi:MAG TPA: iduronate sulfatase, partial [Verrucomicrobiales bacterium]|nr:iduronate sulfatase [Verrucomicrobiales bacterium]
EQIAEMRHGYFANISYLDAQLGKVLDALEKSGKADQTIITFVGDHGYHLGEHSLWGKTSNFEYDARVPFMIASADGKNAGTKTESLAELVDLFPTLVEMCGLPMPKGLDGDSLAAVVADPAQAIKAAAFTQLPRPAYFDREPDKRPKAMGYSVRTEDVRYTEWRDWLTGDVVAKELYDHRNDPSELKNRADDSGLAEAQNQAAKLLRAEFPVVKH